MGKWLGSHSVEYDVLKITANQSADIFNSTIAPTLQNGYKTIGGTTQSLVLNRSLWGAPVKVETFMP